MENEWEILVEIPEFLTHVTLSEKRRTKYFTWDDKLPAKYRSATVPTALKAGLTFSEDGFLLDENKQKVVSNPKTAGTPKLWKINGQSFTIGLHHSARSKIFKFMKEYLTKFVNEQIKGMIPLEEGQFLGIWLEYHAPVGAGDWDLDNATWLWFKWLNDVLKETGKIEDDNINIVRMTNLATFVPVSSHEERRLVFHIIPVDENGVAIFKPTSTSDQSA